MPWTTVVRGKGKAKPSKAVPTYTPTVCGNREYGSGLDRFTMWECAQPPHPCTCGKRVDTQWKGQQQGGAPLGQRTVLQTLVRGPPKGKVIVKAKPLPEKRWKLRQPMAPAVGKLVNSFGMTVVQGSRAYTEREQKVDMNMDAGKQLWQVTPEKPPGSWGVESHPERYKSVLLVGKGVWEACGSAVALLAAWDAVKRVSVIVCAEKAGPGTRTVDHFLAALGTSREGMAIEGTELVVQLSRTREPWEVEEDGLGPQIPPGVQGILVWSRTEEDVQPPVADQEIEAPPAPQTWKAACQLDMNKLMDREVQGKVRTEAWAKKEAWKRCGNVVPGCKVRLPPPMGVGLRGPLLDVEIPLDVGEVLQLMKASGMVPGVSFRPWMTRDMPEALQASVHWLKEDSPVTGLGLQARYAKLKNFEWFRGLVQGDGPMRYGVRAAGQTMDWNHRTEMCQALGLEAQQARVRVQVQGHDYRFDRKAAQMEAQQIFGSDSSIKVVDVWHRSGTRVDRPVYDLQVEGIPPDWEAHRLVPLDPRCPSVTWRRTVTHRTPMPRITVGTKYKIDVDKLREATEKERVRKEEAREERAQKDTRESHVEGEDMTEDDGASAGPIAEGDYTLL